MSDFDNKIKAALHAESDNVWKEVEEQNLFEQALGVMRGKMRFIAMMCYVYMFVFMGLMIWMGFRFFDAASTQAQIAWAVGVLFSAMAVAMLKIWFYMQMDKNTIIREIKRLELQVATLAGIVKNQDRN